VGTPAALITATPTALRRKLRRLRPADEVVTVFS
jgi:hypothetical protein